jgi:hypothetical protein
MASRVDDVRRVWAAAGRLGLCPEFAEHRAAGDGFITHAAAAITGDASGAQEVVKDLLQHIDHLADEAEVNRCTVEDAGLTLDWWHAAPNGMD